MVSERLWVLARSFPNLIVSGWEQHSEHIKGDVRLRGEVTQNVNNAAGMSSMRVTKPAFHSQDECKLESCFGLLIGNNGLT